MDTICYFYRLRERKKDPNGMAETPAKAAGEKTVRSIRSLRFDWKRLWQRFRCRFRADEEKALEEVFSGDELPRQVFLFPDYRLIRIGVPEGVHIDRLRELTEDPDHTFTVCREPLSFFQTNPFRDYARLEWAEHLLRYALDGRGKLKLPDVILLGHSDCLPYLILRHAAELRSLRWYLTERQYRDNEAELVEELEEEYGLIPEIVLLDTEADYGKLRFADNVPCLLLDFSEVEKIQGGGLAERSLWLDFQASEEKERRLTQRGAQILYFSLKKEWKDPQKALEYLDTISKNGYNNSVD